MDNPDLEPRLLECWTWTLTPYRQQFKRMQTS